MSSSTISISDSMCSIKSNFMEETKIQYRGRPIERVLAVTAVCLTFVVIGFIISTAIIGIADRKNLGNELQKKCLTDHCVKIAGDIISNMNTEIDPCKNFYEFSCGGWERRYVIPEDRASYSTFAVVDDKLLLVLRDLLSQDVNPEEPDSFRKARDFYKVCMDEETIEAKDAIPLIRLMEYFGGWPVLGSGPGGKWSSTGYKFETLWAKLWVELNDNDFIISTSVTRDDKDGSRYILEIDQPSLGMPREYYLHSKYADAKEAYLTYMTRIATMLMGDPPTVKQDMADLLEFETKLANLTTPDDERRDSEDLYNLMTLKELSASVPLIEWEYYFVTVDHDIVTPITDSEPIINRNPRFIREVSQLVVVDTPPRVIANYFIWRLTMNCISLLSGRFRDVRQRYIKVLYGASSETPRFSMCSTTINHILGGAVGRMYIDEMFTEADSKANTVEMITYLRHTFIEMLNDNDWIDEETKIVAAQKCNSMDATVGYDEWIKDNKMLDEIYIDINFRDSYFENVVSYWKWTAPNNFRKLLKEVHKTELSSFGAAVVNAYYSRQENEMIFPAGILQPPFFHNKSPWYLNYGGIGVVIGHEITHGFDDVGRQYDKDGNLVQWWSEESIEKFTERAQCIIDQYDSYVMPENDMNLNGKLTQGENMADIGGLKEAYKGYRSFVESRRIEEQLLPGLNFTQDQLFFINFAQVFCRAYRPEGATFAIRRDTHSPGRYRVIGATHNNEDFSRVFGCSKSNPSETKCTIW